MKLVDRTGSVDALMWRLPDELLGGLDCPAYVGIEGQAHEYRGTLQVKVERLKTLRREDISEEDYLPTTEKDRRALAEEILRAGRSFENEHLRELFES
jgi:3'-5' exoribonuclease